MPFLLAQVIQVVSIIYAVITQYKKCSQAINRYPLDSLDFKAIEESSWLEERHDFEEAKKSICVKQKANIKTFTYIQFVSLHIVTNNYS